ncbi:DNA primase [Maribacter phage Molly_5]|uniref:DNA primase n=2 Tax=Mollyvirus TaxID=2948826 RepID=A0A8E4UXS9_9CAUD|nr:DNA primase [Maribacter phage Molly_1]YP_010357365.1 DNA primase [Maribacter phage Colly_1]QQO97609.1 DNA primase [Maribacter phage Molly_2]QQO97809.1 DNA primase [Maribacter phage Molly_3]QQO98010.1 DNA primase [Maribacter phage Molly_4]QQO98210.1 DNA primase [Maribacter phage Molly_5]QQO97214.1 DNA primase [Maribacter phage Colly_1]
MGEFHIDSARENSTGQIILNCPFCVTKGFDEDTKGHLYVSKHTGKYICFRCSTRGQDIYETIPSLPFFFNPDKDFSLDFTKLDLANKKVIFDLDKISKPLDKLGKEMFYLVGRNLTLDQIEFFGFRAGINKFSGYVIFPIHDQFGNVIYFVSRSVKKNAYARYKNPSLVGKVSILANILVARQYDCQFIVEGVFTGLAMGYNWVATLGKYVSEEQAMQLATLSRPIFCPDSEVPIHEIVSNLKRLLQYRQSVEYMPIDRTRKVDLDDLTPDEKNFYLSKIYYVDSFTINDLPKYIENFGKLEADYKKDSFINAKFERDKNKWNIH